MRRPGAAALVTAVTASAALLATTGSRQVLRAQPAAPPTAQSPTAQSPTAQSTTPAASASNRPRARQLGITPGIYPTGPINAITDVGGVRVGHTTLISGDAVRTGVTAIVPHTGNVFQDKVAGAVFVGNAFGKLAGSTQVNELGTIETPIVLTNTLSVGTAMDAVVRYTLAQPGNEQVRSVNALVGETNDGGLNDIRGLHVTTAHVLDAIAKAVGGAVAEGTVGAGTGTMAFGWKGGIGTSSRVVPGGYTVGVLVQTNYGGNLTIDGVPVFRTLQPPRRVANARERELNADVASREAARRIGAPQAERDVPGTDTDVESRGAARGVGAPQAQRDVRGAGAAGVMVRGAGAPGVIDDGSCMIVVATDAPIDARELRRLAARAIFGLGRTGSSYSNGSGDFAIAFSTSPEQRSRFGETAARAHQSLPSDAVSPLFEAALEATEEAVYNSLLQATTVSSRGGTAEALPIDRLRALLRR